MQNAPGLWHLDIRTMLLAEAPILLFVGGLILLAALLGRRDRALLWISAALLLAALGFIISGADPVAQWQRAVASFGSLLVLAHACVWASLRAFSGRKVSWFRLLVAPGAWLLLCLWPEFTASHLLRPLAYGLLTQLYVVAALRALWPVRIRKPGLEILPFGLLILHGLGMLWFLLPVPPPDAAHRLLRSDFPVAVFESMLFFIGMAFAVLIMVCARAEGQYRHAALHDPLTSLANRRALFEQGGRMLMRTTREGRSLALLLCDIDRFKRINDQYGHETGDQVLAQFADVLRVSLRESDLCARLGGEEFVVLAPGLDHLGAMRLADRIRKNLEATRFGIDLSLSISIGISCAPAGGHELGPLLAQADRALYGAKDAGRNRVHLWFDEEQGASVPVAGRGGQGALEHPVDA
jgi:diguanylate cyclase (GGDEF)-like protein